MKSRYTPRRPLTKAQRRKMLYANPFVQMGKRCREVITSYGGKVPGGATLKLIADFAYALDVAIQIRLTAPPVSVSEIVKGGKKK